MLTTEETAGTDEIPPRRSTDWNDIVFGVQLAVDKFGFKIHCKSFHRQPFLPRIFVILNEFNFKG